MITLGDSGDEALNEGCPVLSRSDTARLALLRALAALGTPCLRYKIAPKNGSTSGDIE